MQTNSGPGLFTSLMAGLGIGIASDAMCRAELASGALVRLLTGYRLEPVDVHAVFPAGPRPSAKVRAFFDYLSAAIGRPATALTTA